MTDSDTVLEVKASGTFTLHLSPADGGDLHATLERVFAEAEGVRHVDEIDIDEAYTIEEY